ncbi:hypothetical protein [Crateriforma spongiae]|uniref:hypothetical protein n=1 Tax=Crateriforma spongiae TaxID=2724528 RepID=UPI00144784A6|nr:hypothetical protein [Crateriforma spongiae]
MIFAATAAATFATGSTLQRIVLGRFVLAKAPQFLNGQPQPQNGCHAQQGFQQRQHHRERSAVEVIGVGRQMSLVFIS